MGNNKNKWFLNIFLSILCLTFLLFLLNAAPLICADLPPLDSGSLPFSPFPGANAPTGAGFLPQFGAPYGYGLPYQNTRPGFMPAIGQFGAPYQAPVPGFMAPAGQFGSPYQAPVFSGMPPNYMATGAPYGIPTQAPLYNIPPSAQYGAMNPYVPPSYNTSGTNTNFPVFNTGYNPAAFPNQAFYGPVPNTYALLNVTQAVPGLSAYDPSSIVQGYINPYVNQNAALYGNLTPFSGYNPFQLNQLINPLNPWQQPWSPYRTNINPFTPNNPYQPYVPGYNQSTYYPDTGGNDNDGGDDGGVTQDLPNAKGHWAGNWEAWLIDPNSGVVTDPNDGQPVITMSGEIRFNITEQPSAGGAVLGTIEITNWDIDPQPYEWPGNWTGESDEVILTGWIDVATRYLKARYYYYPGKETSGNYFEKEDYKNIKGLYTWYFNTNKLRITETGISGQFSITGTDGYYQIGVFSTGKYVPQ